MQAVRIEQPETATVYYQSGTQVTWSLQLLHSDNTPVDLTGDSFTTEVYDATGSAISTMFTVTIADAANGILQIEIAQADNASVTIAEYMKWRLLWTHDSTNRVLWKSQLVRESVL